MWNPLEPDLVAEHLVTTTHGERPEVLAGVLVGPAEVVARPIRLYARAAQENPTLARALQPVLDNQLRQLCPLAVEQAATETDRDVILGDTTLASALARWVLVIHARTDVWSTRCISCHPGADLVQNPLAVVLTTQAVEGYRCLAAANAAAYEPDLASSLNNLSNRLADAGRRGGRANRRWSRTVATCRCRRPPTLVTDYPHIKRYASGATARPPRA